MALLSWGSASSRRGSAVSRFALLHFGGFGGGGYEVNKTQTHTSRRENPAEEPRICSSEVHTHPRCTNNPTANTNARGGAGHTLHRAGRKCGFPGSASAGHATFQGCTATHTTSPSACFDPSGSPLPREAVTGPPGRLRAEVAMPPLGAGTPEGGSS